MRLFDEKLLQDPKFKKMSFAGQACFLKLYMEIPHVGIGKFDKDEIVSLYGDVFEELSRFIDFDFEKDLYFIQVFLKTNTNYGSQHGIGIKIFHELEENKDSPLAKKLFLWLNKISSENKFVAVYETLKKFSNNNPNLTKSWITESIEFNPPKVDIQVSKVSKPNCELSKTFADLSDEPPKIKSFIESSYEEQHKIAYENLKQKERVQ